MKTLQDAIHVAEKFVLFNYDLFCFEKCI